MNYLSVDKLEKHYGERTLFENVSFGLAQGDKVALVANNGTGKSTLLRILAGKDIPDGGGFSFRDGLRVHYLEQEPTIDAKPGESLASFVKGASAEVLAIIRDYEDALDQAGSGDKDALRRLEHSTAAMDARQAWDFDQRLETMLGRFGLHDLEQTVESLSGGQRKRLALALTVLDQPDLILLDEPTNHLDIAMVEWLESFLAQANVTLLMVTHDRYFLDLVCNQILEMENGQVYRHQGNYSYFLEKRAQREEAMQTEINKAGRLMKKELEWLRRQPKARTTKSKARIDAFDEVKAKAMSGKKVEELKLDVKMTRIGGKILELKKVYKSYGDQEILKGFDYTFKKGERIGIIGKNGVGKSTFLNIITGKVQPDSGKVNHGDTVVYGYYTQSGLEIKEDKRVIDVLTDIADVIQMSNGSKITASQLLQQFLFPPKVQHNFVSKLSGGERRRLHLLTVLIKNPNFLVLDEPTNDLDLLTLNKLEEFLEHFGGCLIIVTHDRYFMDKLVDHLFIFEGEAVIRDYWGRYSDWKVDQLEKEKAPKEESNRQPEAKVIQPKAERAKLSFKDKYELEQLDAEIPKLEAEKAELEASLDSLPFDQLEATSKRLGELVEELDEKTMRWMELDELRS